MIRIAQDETRGMRILLVDDDPQLRATRAAMLSTHGYEVEAVRDTTEACLHWHTNRPNLVLLALSKNADRNFILCPGIRESLPTQRVGYLLAQSQYLCPVFVEGGVHLRGEGPEDFLGRVQEILNGDLETAAGLPQGAGRAAERETGE